MRVGRQAAGREHADRGARQRLSRQGPGADRARDRGQYREAMAEFAGMTSLDVWYSRLDIESALRELWIAVQARRCASGADHSLAKARTRDSMSAFSKLTESVDGQVRIVDQSPLIVPIDRLVAGGSRGVFARFTSCCGTTADAGLRAARAARAVRARRLGPQGGRGGERRHPRVDRATARPRGTATRCSCRSRRPRRRCWRSSSARASSPTTASAS